MALELKETINLPKTNFSMKANLPQNEPKMLARWEEMGIYERIREARKGGPQYILHDGPPYANGAIHLGHALNKCLKDFIVKTRSMAGFDAPYIPGWDCHGLPIEIKVDEALKGKKREMNPLQVRQACREYAEKFLNLQREQFKRIGVFGRFDEPYSTMTPQYESVVVRTLFDFFKQNAIYKGLRPVYWCIHDQTALAEAEVEYENHTSPSVWVKYLLTSDAAKVNPALGGKKVSTIIWTTTPWTLPASMAVAFHPTEEYVALESNGEVFVVAERLAEVTVKNCGLDYTNVVARFPGKQLEYATFAHPFLERQILGVIADYVTMDQGTGAVHTAPSHGADDFYTGVKYKIDLTCNVDQAGRLKNGLPEYDNVPVFKANPLIVELLKARGVLLHSEKIEHSYPHCWRCHNPVIFRATEQWFISMEASIGGSTLRNRALEEIAKVKWDPAWGEERISNMIATRPDWCISRQRVWGVPIAVFLCEGCSEVVNDPAVHDAVVELFSKEGANSWYNRDAAAILPAGQKCKKCGGTSFKKEMDIIDVWFESGSSYLSVQSHENRYPWPADMYLEGGDQYRGWFHSSLLCAVGSRNSAPYKGVATNGWTLDANGRAMSKSLGNVVDPVDIATRLGGEIVRLWVASVDFREDVRASEELIQRVAENYRKIRNTFRYILGNLNGFSPEKDALPFEELESLDQYMLLRTLEASKTARQWFDEMQYHKVYQQLLAFCVVDLSAVYFDIVKDRLYTAGPNSKPRRSAQTALWRIGETLVRLIAPVLTFTSEEVWQQMPTATDRPLSVHLSLFWDDNAIANPKTASETLRTDWHILLKAREEVLKALELARQEKLIGGGLEAQVTLEAPESMYTVLEKYKDQLRYVFIVSLVTLAKSVSGNGSHGLNVQVAKAAGQKCDRCWNYSTLVGQDPAYPTVCERCSAVLHEIERGA